MTLEDRYNRWGEIADDIFAVISTIETEIGSQSFSEINDRHSLSKIDKKLYEALEIAQKAFKALEDTNNG